MPFVDQPISVFTDRRSSRWNLEENRVVRVGERHFLSHVEVEMRNDVVRYLLTSMTHRQSIGDIYQRGVDSPTSRETIFEQEKWISLQNFRFSSLVFGKMKDKQIFIRCYCLLFSLVDVDTCVCLSFPSRLSLSVCSSVFHLIGFFTESLTNGRYFAQRDSSSMSDDLFVSFHLSTSLSRSSF